MNDINEGGKRTYFLRSAELHNRFNTAHRFPPVIPPKYAPMICHTKQEKKRNIKAMRKKKSDEAGKANEKKKRKGKQKDSKRHTQRPIKPSLV